MMMLIGTSALQGTYHLQKSSKKVFPFTSTFWAALLVKVHRRRPTPKYVSLVDKHHRSLPLSKMAPKCRTLGLVSVLTTRTSGRDVLLIGYTSCSHSFRGDI